MSERAAKDLRRQVRRTVGAEAAAIIERHSAILHNTVLPSLNAQAGHLEAQDRRLTDTQKRAEWVDTEFGNFKARPFWQRVRWLLIGEPSHPSLAEQRTGDQVV